MGMDYLPVYAGEDRDDSDAVSISPQRIQRLGVRSEAIARRMLARPVRAAGTIQIDERRQTVVSLRFESWVERLIVNATGDTVRGGQTLATIFSQPLLFAQAEYVAARGLGAAPKAAATQRLRNLGVPDREIDRLAAGGEARATLEIPAPGDGVVLDKPVIEGMRMMPGETLFRIVDLSSVWVVADVLEADIGGVAVGQKATIALTAYPERRFEGMVGFIYPTLGRETRTARVRVELANPDGLLRAEMLAQVEIDVELAAEPVLAIPDSAVVDSGTRRVALVDLGDGKFEPRTIRIGARAGGYYRLIDGLAEGDRVVTSANFLIDSESNLKAALKSFAAPEQKP